MGKTNGPKLPSFCLSRIRPVVKARSPTIQSKPSPEPKSVAVESVKSSSDQDCGDDHVKPGIGSGIGRKIMIVVDSSFEAKTALQWALSHTVESQDKLLLLHVTKPSSSSSSSQGKVEELKKDRAQLVNSLRKLCQSKRPEVEIEVALVQGKEKGPTIVEEAKKQGVAMLVLGQKRRPTTSWRLIMLWAGNRPTTGPGIAEYCIKNSDCMAVAIRRKNRRHGGYLITTKNHKDFWLLA